MKNLLFSLSIISLFLGIRSISAEEGAPKPDAAAKLGSAVYKLEELSIRKTSVGERRDVVDLPTKTLEKFECHVTTLLPGAMSHPPHRHAQEELVILKEGTLEVSINGKIEKVDAGSFFFFSSNDLHNVKNVGAAPAIYSVFNFTTAATHRVAAEGAQRSAIFSWEKLAVKPTKTGERREITNSPTPTFLNFESHVTTLNPGNSPHPPHHHPDEEWLIVKDGTVDVTINGVTHHAGPGAICFFASNEEHGLTNASSASVTYYILRGVTEATPKEGT